MSRIAIFLPGANVATEEPSYHLPKKQCEKFIAEGRLVSIDKYSAQMVSEEPLKNVPFSDIPTSDDRTRNNVIAAPSATYGCCAICSFNRSVEQAHIIPARFGGPAMPHNLIELCPNHHTLFDRDMLTWDEMSAIWPRVFDALMARIGDSRLDVWRDKLTQLYGVSFNAS